MWWFAVFTGNKGVSLGVSSVWSKAIQDQPSGKLRESMTPSIGPLPGMLRKVPTNDWSPGIREASVNCFLATVYTRVNVCSRARGIGASLLSSHDHRGLGTPSLIICLMLSDSVGLLGLGPC